MKKEWVQRLRTTVLLLAAFFAAGFTADAKPSAPTLYDIKMDAYYVQVSAYLNTATDTIDGFRIYEAPPDMTPDENPETFVLADDIRLYDGNREVYLEGQIVYWLSYRINGFFEPGLRTYYITAYNSDGESDPSNVFASTNPPKTDVPPDYLYFINYPELVAKIGQEYVYTPEIETSLEGDIKFKWDEMMNTEIPEGMTLDESTGEVRWTPAEAGTFIFYLTAYEEQSQITAYQSWSITIMECEVPPTIKLNAVTQENMPFSPASVVFSKDRTMNWDPSNVGGVIDIFMPETTAVSNSIDKGTYYLYITGYGIKSYWYGGTDDPETAVPVTVECAMEYSFDINLESLFTLPDTKVRGSVVDDATGEGIPYAYVEFAGTMDNGVTHSFYSTSTDEYGNYEVDLESGVDYIIRAMVMDFWYEGKEQTTKYLPQYYYLADDITEAKITSFTEDTDNIDFRLKARTPFANGMGGTVKDEKGNALANTYVVAFLVDGEETYYNYFYTGLTMISDNEGKFTGDDFIPGKYVILAMPMEYNVLPGMYVEGDLATWEWEKATVIEMNEETEVSDIDIVLPSCIREIGACVVEGNIGSKGELKSKSNNIQGKSAINGVRLYLYDQQGQSVAKATTDELGYFRMDQIPAGTYSLKADKVGYEKYELEITVGNGSNEVNAEFELTPASPESGVEEEGALSLKAYPNPAADVLSFDFKAGGSTAEVKLIDAKGRVALSRTLDVSAGSGSLTLNVSGVSTGAYIMNVTSGGVSANYPVVIAR